MNMIPISNKSIFELLDEQEKEINTIWKVIIFLMLFLALMIALALMTLRQHQYLQGRVLLLEQKSVVSEQEHSVVTKREKLNAILAPD
jgi:uncharacterized protein YpmS